MWFNTKPHSQAISVSIYLSLPASETGKLTHKALRKNKVCGVNSRLKARGGGYSNAQKREK